MPAGLSDAEFAAQVRESVHEYRIPFVDTPAEYHCLLVRRLRRLDEDLWIVTDGSHWWSWTQEVWTMDRSRRETAEFGRPLQEAYALAEIKAAERRQQHENWLARKFGNGEGPV